MFCNTLWCYTDEAGMATLWAAFITAIPAVIAIVFAYRVGRRQVRLLAAQIAGQDAAEQRAHDLENLKVRIELFEKRWWVFTAVAGYLDYILREGYPPNMGLEEGNPVWAKAADAVSREFAKAIEQSDFLFSQGVKTDLERVRQAAVSLSYYLKVAEAQPEIASQQVLQLQQNFYWLRNNLRTVFGDELDIGERSGSPGNLTDDLLVREPARASQ